MWMECWGLQIIFLDYLQGWASTQNSQTAKISLVIEYQEQYIFSNILQLVYAYMYCYLVYGMSFGFAV